MSDKSKIEWCDATWNPITGCTKVSTGCKNCYAAELHDRRHAAYLRGAKLPAQYAKPFSEIQLFPERLEMPLRWKKPRRIFVNSTSDLFHEDVPFDFVNRIFASMYLGQQHTFMVLTKRPDRMSKWFSPHGYSLRRHAVLYWINQLLDVREQKWEFDIGWPLSNVWLGTSVENADHLDRIDLLRRTQAAVRFISFEPLLGPLGKIDLTGIHWVIVGGESGRNARPMHPEWARSIKDQCGAAGIPFFFKGWGEWYPSAALYDDDIDFMDKMDFGTHCICLGNRGTIFREEWGDREEYWCGYQPEPDQNPWYTEWVGKKRAGRLLDGREWNEYPGDRA